MSLLTAYWDMDDRGSVWLFSKRLQKRSTKVRWTLKCLATALCEAPPIHMPIARYLSNSENSGILNLRSPSLLLLNLTFPFVILYSDMIFAAIDKTYMITGP